MKNSERQKKIKFFVGFYLPACFKHIRPVRNTRKRIAHQLAGKLFALCLAVGAMNHQPAAAPNEAGATTFNFNVPSMFVHEALERVAKQTGHQLLVSSELAETLASSPVKGEYTVLNALAVLLEGTGLTGSVTEGGVIIIHYPRTQTKTTDGETGMNIKKQILAAAIGASLGSGVYGSEAQGEKRVVLEEITITAQKREENLLDVPVSVTAVNAQTLIDSNLLRIQDYYHKVPGLNFAQSDLAGQPLIAIRGIVTGGQSNSTVAHVIDDVPYGATVNPGSPPWSPDIDPGDLASIEVLRGPQGTLYGASSLGGLLKYVTHAPSLEGFSGRMQAGTSSVSRGSDLGHSLRGSVNVPLGDTLAFRASGFTREEPGYIDNLATGERDANNTEAKGGRLSLLWQPSDEFSVKLGALVQDTQRRGSNVIDLSLGGRLANQDLRDTGNYDRESEAYTATITAKLGRADLVSVTGYTVDEIQAVSDISPFVNLLFGVDGSNLGITSAKKFTQEVRGTVPIGERVQWLLGAFYTDEDVRLFQGWRAHDPVTGAVTDTQLLALNQPTKFEEYSAFTNLTVEVTERLDVQVGGRYTENKQAFSSHRSGLGSLLFFGVDPSIVPEAKAKDSAFTYLLTPRWKISPDLMVYARLASGYRPGGANATCGTAFPCEYSADTTRNYDLGFKGSFFDHKLSVDASLYYIVWKDIAVQLFDSGTGLVFNDNVGEAKSQGVEFSVQAQPLRDLTLLVWLAYSDAVLEDTLPPASGLNNAVAGERLPYSSRWSGNLSVEQGFPLWGDVTGSVGGSVSYVGDRKSQFSASSVDRATFPAYTQLDLHASMEYGTWTLRAFANNVTDKRALLGSGPEFVFPNLATYSQPRTLGVSIAKEF